MGAGAGAHAINSPAKVEAKLREERRQDASHISGWDSDLKRSDYQQQAGMHVNHLTPKISLLEEYSKGWRQHRKDEDGPKVNVPFEKIRESLCMLHGASFKPKRKANKALQGWNPKAWTDAHLDDDIDENEDPEELAARQKLALVLGKMGMHNEANAQTESLKTKKKKNKKKEEGAEQITSEQAQAHKNWLVLRTLLLERAQVQRTWMDERKKKEDAERERKERLFLKAVGGRAKATVKDSVKRTAVEDFTIKAAEAAEQARERMKVSKHDREEARVLREKVRKGQLYAPVKIIWESERKKVDSQSRVGSKASLPTTAGATEMSRGPSKTSIANAALEAFVKEAEDNLNRSLSKITQSSSPRRAASKEISGRSMSKTSRASSRSAGF